MKRVFVVTAAALFLSPVFAQEDIDPADYEVVLPDEAQKCVLPAAPDKIPAEATRDDLLAAKGQVGEFQTLLGEFRAGPACKRRRPTRTTRRVTSRPSSRAITTRSKWKSALPSDSTRPCAITRNGRPLPAADRHHWVGNLRVRGADCAAS